MIYNCHSNTKSSYLLPINYYRLPIKSIICLIIIYQSINLSINLSTLYPLDDLQYSSSLILIFSYLFLINHFISLFLPFYTTYTNIQIQIHKYTNTLLSFYTSVSYYSFRTYTLYFIPI